MHLQFEIVISLILENEEEFRRSPRNSRRASTKRKSLVTKWDRDQVATLGRVSGWGAEYDHKERKSLTLAKERAQVKAAAAGANL